LLEFARVVSRRHRHLLFIKIGNRIYNVDGVRALCALMTQIKELEEIDASSFLAAQSDNSESFAIFVQFEKTHFDRECPVQAQQS
jgi:hypothetical protein